MVNNITTLDSVSGTIERFIYQNKQENFSIFLFILDKNSTAIRVTGIFSNITVGQELQITGEWIMHPQFGKQLKATTYQIILPTTEIGVEKYLGSGIIKGIGPAYAKKIVAKFGIHTLTILDNEPERLSEVRGLGEKKIINICEQWKEEKNSSAVMVFLRERGISSTLAAKIYKQYKNDTHAVIMQNPYQLAHDIWGIGFKIADHIAKSIGIIDTDIRRISAGILFALQEITKQGHLYIQQSNLYKNLYVLLSLDATHNDIFFQSIQTLQKEQKIIFINQASEQYITIPEHYYAEYETATMMLTFLRNAQKLPFSQEEIIDTIKKETQQSGIILNHEQEQAIINCFQFPLSIITGGPGTGKTTLIRALIQCIEKGKYRFKLAAPTGRAAKRMASQTNKEAVTIHRLLEFDPIHRKFQHNEHNRIKTNFLIIDEASMIDIFIAHALLKAIAPHTHIIFLGDIDQLPSVGPGNFLKDCIESNKISITKLIEIFRQKQMSMIVANAHRINQGKFPLFADHECSDFQFIKDDNPHNIEYQINQIFTEHHISNNCSDFAILCPTTKGAAGTIQINAIVQKLLNFHESQSITYGGILYKIGDKVMQIRNNYEKLIFNGDIGIFSSINQDDQWITVTFDERIIKYDFDEMNELTLAYAMTIHKSQGSEFNMTIIPLFMYQYIILQRNLLYTAITRTKKKCILIGQTKAVACTISKNKENIRVTFLKSWLSQ